MAQSPGGNVPGKAGDTDQVWLRTGWGRLPTHKPATVQAQREYFQREEAWGKCEKAK